MTGIIKLIHPPHIDAFRPKDNVIIVSIRLDWVKEEETLIQPVLFYMCIIKAYKTL